jgi:hypothetical protein
MRWYGTSRAFLDTQMKFPSMRVTALADRVKENKEWGLWSFYSASWVDRHQRFEGLSCFHLHREDRGSRFIPNTTKIPTKLDCVTFHKTIIFISVAVRSLNLTKEPMFVTTKTLWSEFWCNIIKRFRRRDNSVDIATSYGLDDWGIGVGFQAEARDISVLHSVQGSSGST